MNTPNLITLAHKLLKSFLHMNYVSERLEKEIKDFFLWYDSHLCRKGLWWSLSFFPLSFFLDIFIILFGEKKLPRQSFLKGSYPCILISKCGANFLEDKNSSTTKNVTVICLPWLLCAPPNVTMKWWSNLVYTNLFY